MTGTGVPSGGSIPPQSINSIKSALIMQELYDEPEPGMKSSQALLSRVSTKCACAGRACGMPWPFLAYGRDGCLALNESSLPKQAA